MTFHESKGSKEEELLEKHRAQSEHYLGNAFAALESGDSEKASEFLWGSMAQAIKAVAAASGIELKTHSQLWNYATELARQLQDKDIYDAFHHANSLHSNFYECKLSIEDVYILAEDIRAAAGKLLSLLPKAGNAA